MNKCGILGKGAMTLACSLPTIENWEAFGSVVTARRRNTTKYCPLVDPVAAVDKPLNLLLDLEIIKTQNSETV